MSVPAKQFEIVEVAVDVNGRLSVCPLLPPRVDFEHIYRAAMEVSWDPASKRLVTPPPREWGPADWFKQIVRAGDGDPGAVENILAAFGGMGSLNDLYLCSENGHTVAASELVAVNEKLQYLTGKIWQLARAINRE